jgi:outer membrane receptor protein involved in Fe transport
MKFAARPLIEVLAATWLSLAAASAFGQAIAVKAGTDGAGLELEYGISAHFGARLQIDGASISRHLNKTSVDYDARLKFSNVQALIDWHPLAGAWRLSTGLVYNNNKVDLTATPSGGTFTINGNTYPAASVGSLQGTLDFTKVNPYFGTGWGISPRGHGLFGSIDLGVQWQPNHVSLSATCGAAIQGTPACSQLATDVVAEQAKLQQQTHFLRAWPVIQLGIGWRF